MIATERSVEVPGVGPRTYHFPARITGIELLGALVPVPFERARAWLPAGLHPVRLPGGVSLAMFTVQELGEVTDLGGYAEASFAVFARADAGGRRGFHVLAMPLTSPESRAYGELFFGYPKELATVHLADDGAARKGEVSVAGEPLFSVRVPPGLAVPTRVPLRIRHLQRRDGAVVAVRAKGSGELALTLGSVGVGDAMRARFPGLPSHFTVPGAVRITHGELALDLPRPA